MMRDLGAKCSQVHEAARGVPDFARTHREEVARFGRYPGRNAALGRRTTAAEQAFLDAGGGWQLAPNGRLG